MTVALRSATSMKQNMTELRLLLLLHQLRHNPQMFALLIALLSSDIEFVHEHTNSSM